MEKCTMEEANREGEAFSIVLLTYYSMERGPQYHSG